MILIFNVHN